MMPMAGRNEVPLHIPARYMLVSLVSLAIWIALTPWLLREVLEAPLSYPVIAWTHLLTLGCIGSMILGASIQLIPVALQVPFPAARLAGWAWYAWIAGIMLFEIGFSQEVPPLLAIGASLLGVVLVGYALAVTMMFRATPQRDTVARHLLAASWLAVIGFVLGWLLALTNVNGVLGGHLLPVLAAHIIVMVVGWVMLTLLGVGYKLIGMFTLAERALNQTAATISGVLIAMGAMLLSVTLIFSLALPMATVGALLITWGVLLATLEVAHMYQRRMRKTIDVHMPFAISALAVVLTCSIVLVLLTLSNEPMANRLTVATVWLVLVGGVLTAIQGFFYKISTFLIWLHTYAPLAGKVAVPQLDRMYDRRLAFIGLGAWLVGELTISAMLLGWLPIWWGWSIGLWAGGTLFGINVLRIGRHWRGPVTTPPLAA